MSTTTTAGIPPTTLGQDPGASGGGTGTEKAEMVAQEAKEQGKEIARSATDHARNVIDQARGQLRSQSEEQGRRLAETLRSVGEDLRGMGEASNGQSPAGDVVRTLADTAERWASRLDRDGLAGLGRELGSFGRNRPVLFLAASVGMGFVAGRLVRNADTEQLKQAASGSSQGDSDNAGDTNSAGMASGGTTGGAFAADEQLAATRGAEAIGSEGRYADPDLDIRSGTEADRTIGRAGA